MATKKIEDTGTSLDIVDEDGQVVVPVDDTGLGDYLAHEANDSQLDTVSTHRDIVQQILSRESAMDVLTDTELLNAKDIVGRPFALIATRFNESDFDAGSPWYASMDVHFPDTDTRAVVNCGHQALMAQLIKLDEFKEYPYPVVIKQGTKPNRFGTYPLRLVAVDVTRETPEN